MLIKTTAQRKIFKLKKRVRIVRGGTSASKTFSIIPFLITHAYNEPNSEISIVAETIPHLKRGALRDFLKIMDLVGLYNDASFNKSSLIYTFQNGSYIEFFSADSESKLRGARRDVLFVNECNNITWEAYYQLAIRTRKFIYLDYNPVSEFWVDKELINDVDSEMVILTYLDNEALDKSIVREIEKAKEKAKTSKYWENWYKVYGLGQIGTLQGTVFENWSIAPSIPKDAELIAYSLDWGYSNDPTALVACYKSGQQYYFDELIYQTKLTNSDIIDKLIKLGVSEYSDIIADSAEPKSIEDLRRRGFSVSPAKKGPDSIRASISLLQEIHFKVTENSTNLIKELRNYCWDVDRDGNKMQVPVDDNNHCFIGETLITTNKGLVRIDEIKVNDLVLTSNGYKKVLKVFNNGLQQVINYSIQNDIFNVTLVSTKEHKIKTTKGWKQISKLKSGQMVYLHKDSTEKNIIYTQKKDIFLKVAIDYIKLFMNHLMAKFLKVIKFITRILILGIIILITWNVLKSINIYRNMVSKGLKIILNGLNLFMKKVLNPLKNGISQMMVKSGIQNMVKKFMLKEYLINMYAKYVKKNIKQDIQEEQSTVIKTAKLKHLELGESYQANVYDLMIEDEHEYFANGILVHNCIDALRYLAMNKLSSLSDWMDFD
jgi:phage terminase large subunit